MILLNHPAWSYPVTLEEIKADVEEAKTKFFYREPAFTTPTVEALIWKIDEMQRIIDQLNWKIDEMQRIIDQLNKDCIE